MDPKPWTIDEIFAPDFIKQLEKAADALDEALTELLDNPTIH